MANGTAEVGCSYSDFSQLCDERCQPPDDRQVSSTRIQSVLGARRQNLSRLRVEKPGCAGSRQVIPAILYEVSADRPASISNDQLRDHTGKKRRYWLVLKEIIRAAPCFFSACAGMVLVNNISARKISRREVGGSCWLRFRSLTPPPANTKSPDWLFVRAAQRCLRGGRRGGNAPAPAIFSDLRGRGGRDST
jgi:hypothetical protein